MIVSSRKGRALRLLRGSAIGLVLTAQLTFVMPAIFPDGRAEASDNNITAKVAVNVRSGPGTDHSRLGVLYPGESLSARGAASNGWVPVTWKGHNAWVSSPYVTGGGSWEAGSSTGEKGSAWTQVRLNARNSPSLNAGVQTVLDKGAQVSLTGQLSGRWSQISLNGSTAWVATRYLGSSAPEGSAPTSGSASVSAASTPETIGSRWGSTELNLWTAARGDRFVEIAPTGTEFKVTGTVSGGRAQVVWKGAVRWVTARHLTDSAPTKSSASSGGETCLASFYSDDSATASGEPFNQWAMKTAHKSLPLGTRLRVTNPANGKAVDVTVNDRGPYVAGRCLDLTTGAFQAIADTRQGVAKVSYEIIS